MAFHYLLLKIIFRQRFAEYYYFPSKYAIFMTLFCHFVFSDNRFLLAVRSSAENYMR